MLKGGGKPSKQVTQVAFRKTPWPSSPTRAFPKINHSLKSGLATQTFLRERCRFQGGKSQGRFSHSLPIPIGGRLPIMHSPVGMAQLHEWTAFFGGLMPFLEA